MNAASQLSAAGAGTIRFAVLPGQPQRQFYVMIPSSAKPNGPLLIVVHGISRRAIEQIGSFAGHARQIGLTLIAPLFERAEYGQYQQVIDSRGNRADLALFEMVDAIASQTGCDGQRFHLFGFSGGAQFAHRFAMLHPQRVRSLSIAAAGWYTMPNADLPYPYGIGTHPLPNGAFHLERFLSIDRHVFVGSADRVRDDSLRSSEKLDRLQGTSRLERAQRWIAAMDGASETASVQPDSSTFEILAGVGHSFASATRRRALPRRVLNKIFGDLQVNGG